MPADDNEHVPRKASIELRVRLDGQLVSGITSVGPLVRTTDVIEARDANDPQGVVRLPGRVRYAPITLERGLTNDTTFELWSSSRGRKEVDIELADRRGHVLYAYKIRHAWVSEYQALPDIGASSNAPLVESLRLEHEGWERVAV